MIVFVIGDEGKTDPAGPVPAHDAQWAGSGTHRGFPSKGVMAAQSAFFHAPS